MAKEMIMYKDEYVCVLFFILGLNKQFYEEFSKVTREGYELKAVVLPNIPLVGGSVSAYYYFQRINRDESRIQIEKGSVTKVRFCRNCGNSNELKNTICTKCNKLLSP